MAIEPSQLRAAHCVCVCVWLNQSFRNHTKIGASMSPSLCFFTTRNTPCTPKCPIIYNKSNQFLQSQFLAPTKTYLQTPNYQSISLSTCNRATPVPYADPKSVAKCVYAMKTKKLLKSQPESTHL